MLLNTQAPVTRTYLAEAVYQTLVENIISGALGSGSEISEVALAASLKVSRTPVHAAIERLIKDGLVDQGTNRRLTVASFSHEDLREVYDMRVVLESATAERAAKLISATELADLRKIVDDLARTQDDDDWNERALEFDLHFHDTIARAAGNKRLREETGRYRLLVRAFCRITGSHANLKQAFIEHVRVLEALEARNPSAARRAMADHVRARLKTVLHELPSRD